MRKIWNRPADAVWSLSTQSNSGVGNMNICTYVTAVSLKPKILMVAVYRNTQTLQNCAVGKVALLQLLTQDLAPVVRVCGQKSGKDIDKITRLKKRYELSQQNDLYYFTQCAGYMELSIEQIIDTQGDHVLLLGTVLTGKNLTDTDILTTDYLKENNYIR